MYIAFKHYALKFMHLFLPPLQNFKQGGTCAPAAPALDPPLVLFKLDFIEKQK